MPTTLPWMRDEWIGSSADFTYPAHKARHVSLDKDGGGADTGRHRRDGGKHDEGMYCGATNCSNSTKKCRIHHFIVFPNNWRGWEEDL